jgi:hypothetical protein
LSHPGERQFWKRCSQAAELHGPTETETAGINSARATQTIGTLRRLSPPRPTRRIVAIKATAAGPGCHGFFHKPATRLDRCLKQGHPEGATKIETVHCFDGSAKGRGKI